MSLKSSMVGIVTTTHAHSLMRKHLMITENVQYYYFITGISLVNETSLRRPVAKIVVLSKERVNVLNMYGS